MTGVIGRWFPKSETARVQGYIWAASRMGGALTPFIMIPVIMNLSWRMAFYILGNLGIIWFITWYFWYRNDLSEMKGIIRTEMNEIRDNLNVKREV